jgi:hypothetical protein
VALAAGCGLDHPPTPIEQGMSLMRSGSYAEAIDSFSEAIRLNPRDAQAYLFRGRAYQCRNQAGDLDTAIDDFASAIRFNPEDSEAYYSLAIAYRDRGVATKSKVDREKARFYDEKARRLDSQLGPEVEGQAEADLPLPPIAPLPFATTSTATSQDDKAEAQPEKSGSKEAEASESSQSADEALRRAESKAAEIEKDLDNTTRRRGASGTGGRTFRSAPSSEAGAAATDAARATRRAERYQETNPPRSDPELTRPRVADDLPPIVEEADGVRPITEYDVRRKETSRKEVGGRASRYSSRSPYGAGAGEPSPQLPGTESAIVPPAPRNRSPFPQRQPNPTGFNRMQPVEGTGRQPRPYYTTPDRFRDELR